jgi:hypothetical protein
MKNIKLSFISIYIFVFYLTDALAYSLRTAYEDAANSDPEAIIYAILCALAAYPLLLFACRLKLIRPKGSSSIEYWKHCIRISAKQLFPLIFMIYVVGALILLVVAVAFIMMSHIVLYFTGNTFFKSLDTLFTFLKIVYWCWYIYALFLSIKWLPRSIDKEMLI